MTWAVVLAFAGLVFAVLAFGLRAPKPGWSAIGAALLLGLAGFAWQARPDLAGSPTPSAEQANPSGAAMVAARHAVNGPPGAGVDRWLVTSDAFARNGQFADAAGVVLGAIEDNPRNGEAWLALANDLVAHAGGTLTPAARYAYDRAAAIDPAQPGPPFFLGLALAQSGRLAEGRAQWAQLLARSPADARWRPDLTARLAQLDAFIAAQAGRKTPP